LIDFTNETDTDIDIKLCKKISDYLTTEDIELVAVKSEDIKILNKEYRNIDKTTDVLSFPFEKVPNSPLGSIIINIDKVIEKSNELGHSKNEEFTLLFLHGLLHILGYDHECDNGEMREKEKEIIKKFSLPKSLIVRNV
jgi:probable rRNA maturation factor